MSAELRDLLNELLDELPGPSRPADAVKQAVLDGHARKARNRLVRSVALVSVTCVVVLGGLVAVVRVADRDRPALRTDPSIPPATEPTTLDSSESTRVSGTPLDSVRQPWVLVLPDPPLKDRASELVVPMGDSVFVWGGFVPDHQDGSEPPLSDGAIVDLDNGRWRSITEAPLAGGLATGVWTGSEVVVSNAGQMAAYDPTAGSWRQVTPPSDVPADTQDLALLGNEVVLPIAGWAWNLGDDTWRQITAAPAAVTAPSMDVVGGDLIVSGAPVTVPTATMAMRYDAESDVWTELPPPGSQVQQGDATGVVGNDIVVVSWLSMRAQAMDLNTLQWRDLPTFPTFSAICQGELGPVADSIVVVSMCGQHAALEPGADRWVAFDPPSTSNTFDLHAIDGGLLIDGSILDTETDEWLRSPKLGPVSAGGATVDRTVQPEIRRSAARDTGIDDNAMITLEMVAIDCVLQVGEGELVDQRTVGAAREESQASPEAVEFLNHFGSYTLACPSSAAYATAFDALTVRGERSDPQDALAVFDPPLPATESPEAMADAVAEFIAARDDDLGRTASVGLSAPSGDPVTFVVDSYYDDGAKRGETYTITLTETNDGWVIAEATVQLICTRSPNTAATDPKCESE